MILSIKTQTTQRTESGIRYLKARDEEVLEEANDIIGELLEKLNRRSRYCYTSTEVAKPYDMSGSDLLSFLRDQNVVVKIKGTNRLTKKYRNEGLAEYRYKPCHNQKGELKFKANIVWTTLGKDFIRKMIGKK